MENLETTSEWLAGLNFRMRRPPAWLLSLILPILFCACVAKSTYQELEGEKAKLENELQLAHAERATLRAEMGLEQVKSLEKLKLRLAACEERVVVTQEATERLAREASEKGYYQGIAELHRSIQIAGHSYSTGWWVFSNHYYTVDVSVAGHSMFQQSFETEDAQSSVSEVLGTLATLRELVPYKPRL